MKAALLVVDVQNSFSPPNWLTDRINILLPTMLSVATVERHDESEVPFQKQLGWSPGATDDCLVKTDHVFIKHGYLPPPQLLSCLKTQAVERVSFAVFRRRRVCLPQALRCLTPDCSQRSSPIWWSYLLWIPAGPWASGFGGITSAVS
jgi:hypothetical protein